MDNKKSQSIVLAGDVGGTKTNLGLYDGGRTRPRLKAFQTFSNRNEAKLKQIIVRFLGKHPVSVGGACFGVAGPVVKGKVQTKVSLALLLRKRDRHGSFSFLYSKIF